MNEHHTNRLIHENSPYLLQHAHNPVDWFPWGEEAFEKARKEDKPIFLSIGYATCHWCHVMERESFENESIATYLNEHFVSIKVDREERPDVDMVYMTAVQSMTGQGGWPLTVFLNHDLEPFFGGTYFPPDNGYGRPGFPSILEQINAAWHDKRADIKKYGTRLKELLMQENQTVGDYQTRSYRNTLEAAYQTYTSQFDSINGGFGAAPKFPRPMDIQFLLRYHKATQNRRALTMALITLDKMAAGGIFDHVGGGFHRYATDTHWLVPHFEKMLYDNALLAITYTEAFQVTKSESYKKVVSDVLEFVAREMTDAGGGFFSAQDADSEGEEGKFYVWKNSELKKLLTDNEYKISKLRFGFTEAGNFENGSNIFHLQLPVEEIAKRVNLPEKNIEQILEDVRKKLFRARSNRIKPITDDKVLTSWSALMVSAFAKAAAVFQNTHYSEIAEKALNFLLTEMLKEVGLKHRYRLGEVDIDGLLEDYAFLIQALIDTYELTFELHYLKQALALLEKANELFYDRQNGGYFFVTENRQHTLVRMKDSFDGAIPSCNSTMVLNLFRLAYYTMDDSLRSMALKTAANFAADLERSPLSFAQMLIALDFKERGVKEIVFVQPENNPDNEFKKALQARFFPNRVLAQITAAGETQYNWQEIIPWTRDRLVLERRPTAYVCQNYTCQLPTTDVNEFLKQLEKD